LKGILSPDEMGAMLRGLSDSCTNSITKEEEAKQLTEHGFKLNAILNGRTAKNLDDEKKKGEIKLSLTL
jgi:hypothetical protein